MKPTSILPHWIWIGSISAAISVAMGAFGAHGLRSSVDPKALAIFLTGSQYQMYHSLALIGLGLFETIRGPSTATRVSGWAFLIGIGLFSGSLYSLVLSGQRTFGAITPFGGVAYLVGWLVFAWEAFKTDKT